MKILAVDYGSQKIGIAVSDPMGIIATPLLTIKNLGTDKFISDIAKILEEHSIEIVLFGLPFKNDGSLSEKALEILKVAHKLSKQISIPVTSINEAFTTAEAKHRLSTLPKKRRTPYEERKIIDQLAAVILLEEYLLNIPKEIARLPDIPVININSK